MRAEVDAGTYIAPEGAEMLMSALVDLWMKAQYFENPRTAVQYESRVRVHIKDVPFGRLKLRQVTVPAVCEWIRERRQALDETTVALVFSHLQSMLDLAVDGDLVRKNPCLSTTVKRVKPKRSKPTAKGLPLTWEQTDKIRVELPDRFKATVDCGRGLGMRQGEIFGFGPDDIDWDHEDGPMVHIQRQVVMDGAVLCFDSAKGSDPNNPKDRWVELGDAVADALFDHEEQFPAIEVTLPWREAGGEPHTAKLFFYTRERKPLNRNYFNSFIWKPALAAVGIIAELDPEEKRRGKRKWEPSRDKGTHALRHLYVSMLLASGVDIYTVADRLGHSDPSFTLRKYVHRVQSAGAKVRGALRSMYGTAG